MSPEETYLRTRFLARVAHDARGASSVSLGALDEIALLVADREDLGPLLGIARRGLRRMLRISESLSDAYELESGDVIVARERTDVGRLASSAAERACALEHRRGIVFESRCEPTTALVDGLRMEHAIFELTSNAMRAATSNVLLTVSSAGSLVIEVSDDGPGCAQPAARFTPSSESRGLGLGLALAADVAALHGGQLVVGRERGRTSVKIVLPVAS